MKISELDLNKIPIWAVGGNFIGHMKQAGESHILNQQKPKFLFFIWYPGCGFHNPINQSLNIPREIIENKNKTNICVQTEPELGILAELTCKNNKVVDFTVTHFFPANEISIRGIKNEEILKHTGEMPDYMFNAHRKNWGPGSQGICQTIESLPETNIIPDSLTIESNIISGNKKIPYGVKTKLGNMTFKNQSLWDYIVDEFNLSENYKYLKKMIKNLGNKFKVFICTGATLYHQDYIFDKKQSLAGHKPGEIIEVVISGEYKNKKYYMQLKQQVTSNDLYLDDYVKQGYPQHKILSKILKNRFIF